MTHLDEITLRKAATWQAFKEGEKWLNSGQVGQLASIDGGWRGVVHAGKRRLGVRIRIHSQSDIEVNCACTENQSTGACCSHAVAVALAAIRNTGGQREKSPDTMDVKVSSHAVAATTGWDLQLAQNWNRAMSHGVLVALASRTRRETLQTSDRLIDSWIATGKASDQSPIHLQVRGDDAANLLRAMAGNEGFAQEGNSKRNEVSIGDLIQLENAEPIGNAVQLDTCPMPDPWLPMGDTLVRVDRDGIHLAGTGTLPAAIRKSLEVLTSTAASARVPIHDWIRDLSLWQDWVALPEKSWLNELQFIAASAAYHLELTGTPSSITAQLRVGYHDCEPRPVGTGEIDCLPHLDQDLKKCELRDAIGEAAARQRLIHIGFHAHDANQSEFQLNGASEVTRFLAIQLPDLTQEWHVNIAANLQRHREKITLIKPQIESTDQAHDSTDFRLVYRTSEGALIPDEAIRKMLRAGNGLQKTPQNQILCLDVQSTELLDDLLDDLELERSPGVIKAKSCAADLIRSFHKGTWSGSPISNLPDDDFRPPSTIEATLRPYQLHGASWLVDRLKRYGGAVLADDMGLGKTLQAIVCIEHLIESMKSTHGPSLIVASTSLLGNWQAEYARFAPHRSVRVMHGAQRDSVRDQVRSNDILITSYGTLVRDLAWHLRQFYHVVVADEASLMRNPDTDHARAMAKLHCDCRIALSGTPVENSLHDLWSIFRFVQPGWLGSRSHFKERYEARQNPSPINSRSLEVLKIKTSPFILRRTKQQVAPELPRKIEIDEMCELSADQQQIYRSLIEEGRREVEALREQRINGAARMRMLTLLLRLRQTCCDLALLNNEQLNSLPVARRSSKLERLINLLDEARNGGHKTLVFSQFSTQLLAIESQIQSQGWRSLRLDGSTRNRQELVEQFQSDQGPEIFLISLKAGGYGLNLTAADTVVHFDPWWNPAAEAQASDRAHRIGQTRPVSIYRLLTRNTVEEKVVKMQADKRGLARAIDESGAADAGPSWLDDPKRLRAIFES